MKKLLPYKLIILSVALVLAFSIGDIVMPDKSYSQLENRPLTQAPVFSFKSLFSNEFTGKYEDYIDDQFMGRDQWIDIKSRCEFYLGKVENNGIVYGKNHFMFEKYRSTNEERLAKNVDFIKKYIETSQSDVLFSIVPSSYMKNLDKVPYGLENLDQDKYIKRINEDIENIKNKNGVKTQTYDMKDLMIDYYKTDHHWTTLGAYKAYEGMMKSLKLPYVSMDASILGDEKKGNKTLGQVDVQDFYGTYFNKTKSFNAVPDVLSYYHIPVKKVTIDGKESDSLYDLEKLKGRDKYAMFLKGNNGITVIESENRVRLPNEEKTRVLLIKDSFGNSFAPYLTYSFDEVVVVDLRSLNGKMSQVMAQYEFDQTIIMYNFMNLAQDVNVAKINY